MPYKEKEWERGGGMEGGVVGVHVKKKLGTVLCEFLFTVSPSEKLVQNGPKYPERSDQNTG